MKNLRNLIKPQLGLPCTQAALTKVKKRPSSSAKKRPSSAAPRGAKRKGQPDPKPVDLHMKKLDIFKWAHRICSALVKSGYDKCPFHVPKAVWNPSSTTSWASVLNYTSNRPRISRLLVAKFACQPVGTLGVKQNN